MATQMTTADFKEKVFNYEQDKEWNYKGNIPAIIDFYADWCAPCKMVSPILDELSEEYQGKVHIYKVNTEKEQDVAAAFGITSIPSILFIPVDEPPQMAHGALPKDAFVSAIKEVLKVA